MNQKTQARKVNFPLQDIKEITLRFLSDEGIESATCTNDNNGQIIDSQSTPEIKFLEENIYVYVPSYKNFFKVTIQPDGDGSIVNFSSKNSPEYDRWVFKKMLNSIIRIVASLLFVFVVAVKPYSLDKFLVDGSFLARLLAGFMVIAMPIILLPIMGYAGLMSTHNSWVQTMHNKYWQTLERLGKRILRIQDDAFESIRETNRIIIATSVCSVLVAAIAYLTSTYAIIILWSLFFFLPILTWAILSRISHQLPYRYRYMYFRLYFCLLWYLTTLAPYLMIARPVMEFPGAFVMIFLLQIAIFYGILIEVGKFRNQYKSILFSPSSGYEDFYLPANKSLIYRLCTWSFFMVLALTFIVEILYLPSLIAAILYADYGALILIPSILPILLTFAFWLSILRKKIIKRRTAITKDKEIAFIDTLTRSGLYKEIKEALDTQHLNVRVGITAGIVAFGTAIEQNNIFRSGYTIFIDPYIFSIINNNQREAILWHEVGHFQHTNIFKDLLYLLTFNVWAQNAKDMMNDTFREEIKADQFAINRMENKNTLVKALKKIRSAGIGYEILERQSFMEELSLVFKIIFGYEGQVYTHPHLDVRLVFLENQQ